MSTNRTDKSVFERRLADCQSRMYGHGVDLLVLSPGPNLLYLTGFDEAPSERFLTLLVPAAGAPAFVVPAMYRDHVRRDTWVGDVRPWMDGDDPLLVLESAVAKMAPAPKHVLVDERMWALFALPLREMFKESDVGLASALLAPMRMRKDEAELALLRRAGGIADRTFEWVCQQPFEGRSELEIADLLERRMRALGGEGVAFKILVASGPNSALPHHSAGPRVIECGDAVILDFGCRVGGYHSDITRTVTCGQAPDEMRSVYRLVQRAQAVGVKACRPGVRAEAIDGTTRALIEAAGHGERFIHRTGHGLGLEPHEPPYIVAGDSTQLEVGMAFSVEPGIYLLGEFGVRIEDVVAITHDGVEPLNRCTHELQIVR